MIRSSLYAAFVTSAVILTPGSAGVAAEDFELARDAVERGEILPLARLLPQIEKDYAGKVIEVELEISLKGKVYEFEVLTSAGQLLEVDVDAATGKVLDVDEEDG